MDPLILIILISILLIVERTAVLIVVAEMLVQLCSNQEQKHMRGIWIPVVPRIV